MSRAVRSIASAFPLLVAVWASTSANAADAAPGGVSADDRAGGANVIDAIGRMAPSREGGPGALDDERSNVAVFGARALFGTNEARLTTEGEQALDRLVRQLVSMHVARESLVGIQVVGHADGVGSDAHNLSLSKRRAASVGDLIASRYPEVSIALAGAGERSPVASDASAAGRARNRRVEIRVVAFERR